MTVELPGRRPRSAAERLVFPVTSLAMVVAGVSSMIGGNVIAGIWGIGAAIAWLSASYLSARLDLAHIQILALETMLGIVRAGEPEGLTRAVIRTKHPEHFLLHNTHDGTRWRMSERGWTKEDW